MSAKQSKEVAVR